MAKRRGAFASALRDLDARRDAKRWLYVPYDQLHDGIGPLSREDPDDVGIVIVETPAKPARRRYHKHKLAFVLANERQFALEQARRGVAVRHVVHEDGFAAALRETADDVGTITVMEPAEKELRDELAPLVDDGALEVVPHEGWLTDEETFRKSQKNGPPYRMDAFYRAVRKRHDVLMDDDGKPVGGKYSFDADNREAWDGEPAAPEPPTVEPDDVTAEVIDLVNDRFAAHPGEVDPEHLPTTRDDAETLWRWALRDCMEHFGPYEDAMSTRSSGLFHTRVSALLNVHRLLPSRVVADVEALDVPLNSREGFLRQVWGWREFMRHVHRETEGLRRHFDASPRAPQRSANLLDSKTPLPAAYWPGAPSGLRCLDEVVDDVWREAYSHHITRLMVLSNIGTLLDVDPGELTDWFWVAYVDAFDWVVEPNVIGMGTFAAGELLSTKPYVSGAAYIHKMGNYCGDCAFHPKKTCPITRLYWAFLARHEDVLGDNHRMNLVYGSLAKRSKTDRDEDARTFEHVRDVLGQGERLSPEGEFDFG